MARETRKLKRVQERSTDDVASGKERRRALQQPGGTGAAAAELPDPFGPAQQRQLLTRLGLPVAGVWGVGALVAAVAQSPTTRWIALGLPLLITLVVGGIVVWAYRQAQKARSVAGILRKVETGDDRAAALAELDQGFKQDDPAAVFARAQLLLQEDPRKALEVLERIDLAKVMAPVADEARGQRALIHLMLGEVSPARQLVDGIGLDRHQDVKTRAMLSAVCAEAWSRSGNAAKAETTLQLFDPDDPELAPVKPQLWRARAYAAAHTGNQKQLRRALARLLEQDVRLLGAFLNKKSHPLLQKEAKKLLEQSGLVPRRMEVQRR